MTNKDRQGINNFDTNTRARVIIRIHPCFLMFFYTNTRVIMQPLEFLEPIKRKEDQDTRKIKPYARDKITCYLCYHKT
nr:MAG TPA: hypothetical protein [Caudoviricetes sp.]